MFVCAFVCVCVCLCARLSEFVCCVWCVCEALRVWVCCRMYVRVQDDVHAVCVCVCGLSPLYSSLDHPNVIRYIGAGITPPHVYLVCYCGLVKHRPLDGYPQTHRRIRPHTSPYLHTYIHIPCTYIHTYIHTYTYIHIHTYIHTYMRR